MRSSSRNIFYFGKMERINSNMIMKIYLEKTFGRLEWSFIRDSLDFFNFLLKSPNSSCHSSYHLPSLSLLMGKHTKLPKHNANPGYFQQQIKPKINHSKSKIIFSHNSSITNSKKCATILKMPTRPHFGKYFRFPIFHSKPDNNDFQFIIHNLKTKLNGWKTKFLNMIERIVLAKSSINKIISHVMQYIQLPAKVNDNINRIVRNFIWCATCRKEKVAPNRERNRGNGCA
ncbi:hypothetical protein H5410_056906 [Solanum commersonii]|uniref:Uncharacterized protein n=1 Tax=Solanum commersonii TaxID=4109 RepID=A0A9J5WNL8_SOLCO|nr:hypothetical protein H5410_056906 [Solanum commersonii]